MMTATEPASTPTTPEEIEDFASDLGRAPLPSAFTTPVRTDVFTMVLLDALAESPLNPRKTFDDSKLEELAASIREKGLIEPIVVRRTGHAAYEIVCGARRTRAARMAGLVEVPAIVREYTDRQAVEVMTIENGQRDDVAPLEEAAGYKQLLLIDQTYTPATIATRIGHSERYVYDRLRLLDLIPVLQEHLTAGRIGVEHAEVLAKLKPEEQKTAAHPERGALFERDYALRFDTDPNATHFKARSVRQLKEWIATHIRFDVKHAAKTAPLEFADTAARVEEAESQPGRGKKVVSITYEHVCPSGAKDADERTYGATAWKRAEGKHGPTCDHAVLGVVVAGEHYGTSHHVCIARDKCTTHWKESVAAKQKAEQLRAAGKGKQAAKVEKKQQARQEDTWERERKERAVREAAWTAIKSAVMADAVDQVKDITELSARHAAALEKANESIGYADIKKHLGAQWFTTPAAALLVSAVTGFHFNSWQTKGSGFDQFVREVAKPFGLDVKRLTAIRDRQQAPAAPETTKTPGARKVAKKR